MLAHEPQAAGFVGLSPGGAAHIPGLDGLRGLACLMVFGVHFGQITHLSGNWGPFGLGRLLANGNTGVALFFVLSGFLLSLPYWQARARGLPAPRPGRFLARRAARILPAYFVCLGALVVANRHWQETDGGLDILLHVLMVFNFREASTLSINPPFWTLAVEMQFYLLVPLLFLAVRPAGRWQSFCALLLLAVAAYLAHWHRVGGVAAPPAHHTYSLLAHMPHFILGMLTACLCLRRLDAAPRKPAASAVQADMLLLLVLALLVLILSTPLDDALQLPAARYNLPFVPLLLCGLVVLVATGRLGRLIFDHPLLSGIGVVSYGVYIFHLPVQHVAARLMGRLALRPDEHWLLFGAVSLAVTLTVATASYLLVERPVRRLVR
jgi:peptidoglycan/LPS O-acetylase OafA/YrhL